MVAILLAVGVHLSMLSMAGVTLAVKIKAACIQLGINIDGLTMPAALQACNEAANIGQDGVVPLLAQADALVEQLGLSFESPPPEQQVEDASTTRHDKPASSVGSLSVHAVMSAPLTIQKFSAEKVPEEAVARAMACQFWAPNHKLKGSWRFVQLGSESRLAAARLSAGQAAGKGEGRFEALKHIPGCCVVVCKAYYDSADRVDRERERAQTAVHNVALGLSSEGLGVKWVTGAAVTENYELWELVSLEPNEEVLVGLLWFGWPAAADGARPVRDGGTASERLTRLP